MLRRVNVERLQDADMSPPYLNPSHLEAWGTSPVYSMNTDVYQEQSSVEDVRPIVAEQNVPHKRREPSVVYHHKNYNYSIFTKCAAEILGSLGYVFLGSVAAYSPILLAGDALLRTALVYGLIVFTLNATLGHISGGHFNPVISWAATLTGLLHIFELPFYMVSQLVGALLGSLLSRAVLDAAAFAAINAGAAKLTVDWWQGLISEGVVTFFFVQTFLNTVVISDDDDHDRDGGKSSRMGPLALGLTMAMVVLATGSLTGASMNPARSVAQSLMGYAFITPQPDHTWWGYHYIYWAGPYLGSSIAVGFYWLLQSERRRLLR